MQLVLFVLLIMLVTFPNPSIVSFFYILIQIILTATLIGPRNLTAGLFGLILNEFYWN